MRPRRLDEFAGQRHFLGADKLLTRMLEADRLSSLIFHGSPGVGKTSPADLFAGGRGDIVDEVCAVMTIWRLVVRFWQGGNY